MALSTSGKEEMAILTQKEGSFRPQEINSMLHLQSKGPFCQKLPLGKKMSESFDTSHRE